MDLKKQLDALDHWPLMEKMLGQQVKERQMLRSPLRQGDQHPSFGLFRNRAGQARWKDFAMDNGDVYHLAKELYQLPAFRDQLIKVAQLAGMMPGEPGAIKPPTLDLRKMAEKISAKCRWEYRGWDVCDTWFWVDRYLVPQPLLSNYGIVPCEWFEITGSDRKVTMFHHHDDNPMYVIQIGDHAKLYRPFNKDRKYKYIGNTTRLDIFGLAQLKDHVCMVPETKLDIVFTGGQKDAVVVRHHLGVMPLAFNSESTVPDDSTMYRIFTMMKSGYILYDNDDTGRKYATRLAGRFPFLKVIDLGAYTSSKDPSDMIHNGETDAIAALRAFIHG